MKHIFNFKFGFFFFVGIVLGMLYVLISDSNKVSESDVKEKLDEIFQIVDNDVDRFGEIVTDDFFIFENRNLISQRLVSIYYIRNFFQFWHIRYAI